MCTPEEKFFTPLSATEYRVLDILCMLSDANGKSLPTMEELARYGQCSEESIRRALRKLEEVDLLKVERTKRNLGKFSYNVYQLISPSHKNVEKTVLPSHKFVENSELPSHKNVGSTADIDSNTIEIENKTTSYSVFARKNKRKGIVVVGNWQEDDKDLAGFGLFDDEVPASKQQPKPSKRSSKTRHLRPQEDWTALDVAAEFSAKVHNKLPMVMNAVNTINLQKIIAKNRKQYNLTPIIELAVMDAFFSDNWFLNHAKDSPQYIQPRFLKFFTSHLPKVMEELGMDVTSAIAKAPTANLDTQFIYASDGTRFDNSMPGRKNLARYEERLAREAQ